ncbi:cytochrome c biogenesis protein DipZ, partial [Candidatus Peregrinibacteria bacterium]|nr:cytochrome c biogenesis protein DipZ [Candidatus Peregrinibacteria bacterium]
PRLNAVFEHMASVLATAGTRLRKKPSPSAVGSGFFGGMLVGVSLGLIWTPCVGPILASVISLALTGSVTAEAFLITLSYSIGTALPMLAILYGGRQLIQQVPWLTRHLGTLQKCFGWLMILTALAIAFNVDRQFQTYVLKQFPNYGKGLTSFEENAPVQQALGKKMPIVPPADDVGAPKAPELIPGGVWFNSPPLTLAQLRGKVVLIDFWTYSCINCIRTLPYLKAWHEKYANQGLVIIGVHSPEFEFEKNPDNVQRALKDFGIGYPVMQDNNFATWTAYNNHYWPAKYFIDATGKLVSTHFGEGEYDESEALIQKMLQEAGHPVSEPIQNESTPIYSATPETYVGASRIDRFASPEPMIPDEEGVYTFPETLGRNAIAFSGKWLVEDEMSSPRKGAKLRLDFESKRVFLVLRPLGADSGQVRATLDGKPIADSAGKDVAAGVATVDQDRLYELVNLAEPGRHTLELEFLDSNTGVYAFTFG